jgi:hypothetical protein
MGTSGPVRRVARLVCLGVLGVVVGGVAARAQDITQDSAQVRPLRILSRDHLLTAAQIGVGVAVALNPELEGVHKLADFTALTLDEAVKATAFRNSIVESHLLVVSAEATKLEDLRTRDGNLDSPEAQAILDDLRRGHFATDGTGMFLARSVVSGRMAYGVASHYYLNKWMKAFFGGTLGRRLPLGNRVERVWLARNGLVRTYTNIPWRYLTTLAESSRLLTDAIKKVLLQKIGKALGQYAVQSTLDQEVERILADHPSIPEAAVYLRLDAMNDPRLLMPMAQPAMPVAAVAAAVPIAVPRAIAVQADPVVSAASVQHQVLSEPQYRVDTGGSESAHVEPVEHPTHRDLPTSISIGGSFTGGSGSTLFSRF